MRRLGIRRRLLLVIVSAVTAAVAALLVAFNVAFANRLDAYSHDLLRTRAAQQLALIREDHGRLIFLDVPDAAGPDANVWIFSNGNVVEQPRSGARVNAAARRLAGGPPRFADLSSSDTRFYAVPVVVSGRRLGTVVVASSLEPQEHTRRVALVGSLIFGGMVLLLVAVASRWLLAAALRPVRRMTRQAATWSERDLDQRFAVGNPYDELTELAATLDGLLDRLAASLRHEQRFSAELSHELRTPIARVLAESELALLRERTPEDYRSALAIVHRNAQHLAKIVDTLVAAARHEAGSVRGTADAFAVAAEVSEACASLVSDGRIKLEVEEPDRPVRLGIDADLAERILQPVLENACRYGSTRVRVSIERRDSTVRYLVADDGPGVSDDERERIFEPGVRGRLGEAGGSDGAGLGLSLARRLARSMTGDVELLTDAHGASFLVRLPAA
ncbi:MAG TPA: ATP-binding protein [Gaiellaceae bacterium]|nr:ATP-binding protein [Gaiellaceae bacterium]